MLPLILDLRTFEADSLLLTVMHAIKRWVKDFFELSHAQANGFIVLIPLLLIILFSEPLWHWYVSRQPDDNTEDLAMLDSLTSEWNKKKEPGRESTFAVASKPHFFSFDPNHASESELERLGFSSTLATRIAHYREKGGKFRVKADVLKIFGVDTSFYRQLYAFIDLPERNVFNRKDGRIFNEKDKTPVLRKDRPEKKSTPLFDLNTADTTQLKTVYGIGEKLSLRILKYRDALGGFIAMDQVTEIFGLDSVVVGKLQKACFLDRNFSPRKLNINTLDEKNLAVHPYLRKTVARSIVAYRFQHGEFKTLEDLRSIHTLDAKTIEKILPYLTID